LQRSTFDRGVWPVYRTERLPLYIMIQMRPPVARVHLRQLDAYFELKACKRSRFFLRKQVRATDNS